MSAPDPNDPAAFLEHDDIEEICRVGRCGIIMWLKTIEPFQEVRFVYPEWEAERIGKDLTAHVDAEGRAKRKERCEQERADRERARTAAGERTLSVICAEIGEEAAYWREWRGLRDDGAAGW